MNGVWDTDPPLLITLKTDAQTFLATANASFLFTFLRRSQCFPSMFASFNQPEVQQSFPFNFKFCRVDLLLLRRDMLGRIQK